MENREKILSIALNLFSARGYDATGVQEIAAAAGVTKPTLYHYFGSKRGLIDALLADYGERLCENLTKAAAYNRDITKTLNDVAFTFTQFAAENKSYYRLLLSLYFAPDESEAKLAALKWNEAIHKIIEELFLKASQDHGNMKNRQAAYSASFVGTINTFIGMSFNGYVVLSEPAIRAAVKQFMHGIFS